MEKPILFSTEMVQAILAGRKTMTRRIIKPQPTMYDFENHKALAFKEPFTKPGYIAIGVDRVKECPSYLRCPYGQIGDVLWVRETWAQLDMDYRAVEGKLNGEEFRGCPIAYKANNDAPEHFGCWRPSIFMPRTAARLFLKVKDIRVERLQDITNKEAIKEGIDKGKSFYGRNISPDDYPITQFQNLWDGINSKRGYGWDINPWVWVVEFERVEDPNEL